jgi:glycosyltransferase involved in cell wall biosynthesis
MKKPKILLVADRPNWAWDRKSLAIKKNLGSSFDFDIAYSDNKKIKLDEYSAVLMYWYNQYLQNFQELENFGGSVFVGISSFFEVSNSRQQNLIKEISEKENHKVFVHNKALFDKFKNSIQNLSLCPNGVDTDEFQNFKKIKPDKQKLTIGFVGNSASGGRKGINDIIIPAIKEIDGVEIKMLDPKKNKITKLNDMADFYNSIDCYVCASDNEGTPNPCLEAASCGRPLITTRVGNMPELVKDYENSLFCERSIESVREKILFYRDNRDELINHGNKIQKEILENWCWSKQCLNYKKMFTS